MNRKEKPLLSICCITYNQKDFIRDTIEGFLMQKTNFTFEIIIHDDASTDGTAEIIKEYVDRFPDFFFPIFQKENQYSKGKKPFPNFVIPKANGRYIAICEGDDYWTEPTKLQKQVEFLELHPEYSGCFHNTLIKGYGRKDLFINGEIHKTISVEGLMEMKSCGHTSSWVFRKNALQNPGEYYKNFPVDRTLSILIAEHGFWGGFNDVMSVYRINEGGIYGLKSSLRQNKFLLETTKALYSDLKFRKKYKKALRNRFAYLYRSRAKLFKEQQRLIHYFSNLFLFSWYFGFKLSLLKILLKEEFLGSLFLEKNKQK